jgi:NADPH:quinone reductase-like Zn-dependent oxidoreductase
VNIEEVATPVPRDNEVLVAIRATSVSAADMRARSLAMPRGFGVSGHPAFGFFGTRKPILGAEFTGEVVATGPRVTRFP